MLQRFFICLAICFLAQFQSSFACRCGYMEIHEAIESADAVVVGEPLGVRHVLNNDSSENQTFRREFAILVKKSFKGIQKENDTIFITNWPSVIKINDTLSYRIHSACDFIFESSKEHIIYGNYFRKEMKDSNVFTTSICHRTQLKNEEEIAGIQEELAPPQTFPVAFRRFFRNLFKGIFW